MALVGLPIVPKQMMRFTVTIPGVSNAKFRDMSELSAEIAESQIFHGGSPIPHKAPARVTMSDVTLARGAINDGSLMRWYADTVTGLITGSVPEAYKRPVNVFERDRNGRVLNVWNLINCWIKKYVAGEWNNESDDFVIEQVTLAYDYFVPVRLPNAPTPEAFSIIAAQLG
jgi:phage tail-like protein